MRSADSEGGLAEYGLPLVVGVRSHRAGGRDPLLRGLQRVGVTIACDDQVRQLTDALDLGPGRKACVSPVTGQWLLCLGDAALSPLSR